VQTIVLAANLLLIAGDGERHTVQAGQTVFCTQAPDRPNRVSLRLWVDRGPKRFFAERGMDLLELAPIILQKTL
jgi:tRNA (Thr-GGU) A37 N-methylase